MDSLQYSIATRIDRDSDGTLNYYIQKYNIPSQIEYLEADELELTSLEGGDKLLHIEKHFGCTTNKLVNLIGGPQHFGQSASYYCGGNDYLISLEGAPLLINYFSSDNNTSLKTLEGIGRKYLKEVEHLNLKNCRISNNILGLCLIKNLKELYDNSRNQILTKIAFEFKGEVLEAQEWLIENGYKQLAKL